jgi:hypothetical protein
MENKTTTICLIGAFFSLAAYAGGGGIMGLKSPDGTMGHAVTVESSPDGGGAGDWTIRDNEAGCEEAVLSITMSGDPLAITACTADPASLSACCDELSGWTKSFFRKLKVPDASDTDEPTPIDDAPTPLEP